VTDFGSQSSAIRRSIAVHDGFTISSITTLLSVLNCYMQADSSAARPWLARITAAEHVFDLPVQLALWLPPITLFTYDAYVAVKS
jgi:hypothetical protein